MLNVWIVFQKYQEPQIQYALYTLVYSISNSLCIWDELHIYVFYRHVSNPIYFYCNQDSLGTNRPDQIGRKNSETVFFSFLFFFPSFPCQVALDFSACSSVDKSARLRHPANRALPDHQWRSHLFFTHKEYPRGRHLHLALNFCTI